MATPGGGIFGSRRSGGSIWGPGRVSGGPGVDLRRSREASRGMDNLTCEGIPGGGLEVQTGVSQGSPGGHFGESIWGLKMTSK